MFRAEPGVDGLLVGVDRGVPFGGLLLLLCLEVLLSCLLEGGEAILISLLPDLMLILGVIASFEVFVKHETKNPRVVGDRGARNGLKLQLFLSHMIHS